jgi:hypothetical protein
MVARTQKKIKTRKSGMNAFMKLKEKSRKSGAKEFKYTNKEGKTVTYIRAKTKTGMVIFKRK